MLRAGIWKNQLMAEHFESDKHNLQLNLVTVSSIGHIYGLRNRWRMLKIIVR